MQGHQMKQPIVWSVDLIFLNLFNAEKLRSEMAFVWGATKIKFNNLKTLARIGWPNDSENID